MDDIMREEMGNKNHLKKFLKRVYFEEYSIDIDNVIFRISYSFKTVMGIPFFPHRFFKRYELLMIDVKNNHIFRKPISEGEKDALQIFVDVVRK
jgi:hypothetical protein